MARIECCGAPTYIASGRAQRIYNYFRYDGYIDDVKPINTSYIGYRSATGNNARLYRQ